MVKNLPANARAVRDVGLIPGSGRSLGGGYAAHSCSCQRSQAGYGPQGHKESGMTEVT